MISNNLSNYFGGVDTQLSKMSLFAPINKIKINNELSLPEPVFVRRSGDFKCKCSVDEMWPDYAINLPLSMGEKICRTCGNSVDFEKVDHYNRVNGFSGYDEFPDNDYDEEDHEE